MGKPWWSRRAVLVALLVGLTASWGCATAQWARPIGQFQASVDESVAVIGAYYDDLNAFERRVYLENAYLDPSEEILFRDATGAPTPLAGGTFSAASIGARLDALRLVSLYGRRLASLAGSEAPNEFASNAKALGATLAGLSGTFEGLARSGSDSSAGAYVAPVASLIGLIGGHVLEGRRDAAITAAVTQGDPPVVAILDQIERDLALVVDPLRATGEKLLLTGLIGDYNENRATLTPDERRRRIDHIAAAADASSTAASADPAALVAGLREAHQALVAYASSPRKPANLGEFAAALEVFANRVEAAAAEIRAIRDARELD
jgi:hypothetical protein